MSLWQVLIVLAVVAVIAFLVIWKLNRDARTKSEIESRRVAQAKELNRLNADVKRLLSEARDAQAASLRFAMTLKHQAPPSTGAPGADSDDDDFCNDEPLVRMRPDWSSTVRDEICRVSFYAQRDAKRPGKYYLVVTEETARTRSPWYPPSQPNALDTDFRTPDGFAALKSAFDNAVSKALVDGSGAWDVATKAWQTTQSMTLGEIADNIGALKVGIHETLVRSPAEVVSDQFALNPLQDSAATAILEAYPLPGDTLFRNLKLLVQVSGMVVGALVGNPLVANACFKSWIHDETRRFVASSVNDFFFARQPSAKHDLEQDQTPASTSYRGLVAGLVAVSGLEQAAQEQSDISRAYLPYGDTDQGIITLYDPDERVGARNRAHGR